MIELALSSFWMRERFARLRDGFETGLTLGFRSFELSGIDGDEFYSSIRPGEFEMATLHDPAPGPLHSVELRQRDVVLTSLDEVRRRQAVAIMKNSMEVAVRYGARVVVIHLGQTEARPALAEQLKRLFVAGKIASAQAEAIRSQIALERAQHYDEHIDALRRSLDELVTWAAERALRLGIENRPACEMPNWAEMGKILEWYPEETIGYWHDTGHAELQAALGFAPHADWLRAYGSRLIGVHLHDTRQDQLHRAPGTGRVDWAAIAPLIPANASHVVEVDHVVSPDELSAGVEFLKRLHCTG